MHTQSYLNKLLPIIALAAPMVSYAEEKAKPAENTTQSAEHVNVDAIKEKYWARGDESELGVVQNRLYSKENKIEVNLFGGLISTDPFLSVKSLGGSIGYHVNELWSFHVLSWKDYSSPSSALDAFRQYSSGDANTNNPKSYFGGEAAASILYGKLSLLGKAIIYYDLHLLGGYGVTSTESGNDLTASLGIGQQIYASKHTAIRIDYRMMRYTETILEKINAAARPIGTPVDDRVNYSHAITLGVTFLIGGDSK